MKVLPYLALVIAGLIQAAASAVLKYSSVYKSIPGMHFYIYYLIFFGAMAMFPCAFPLIVYGMSRLKLTVYQPLLSGTMYMVTYLLGIVLFKEPVILNHLIGIAVILAGVYLVVGVDVKPSQ